MTQQIRFAQPNGENWSENGQWLNAISSSGTFKLSLINACEREVLSAVICNVFFAKVSVVFSNVNVNKHLRSLRYIYDTFVISKFELL